MENKIRTDEGEGSVQYNPVPVSLDDTNLAVDGELLNGLFNFKNLLERKLVPANFPGEKKVLENGETSEEYELQVAKATCPPEWGNNLLRVSITEAQIQAKVKELADRISRDYEGKEFVAVGLLTGAICFMTDLLKYMRTPYTIDFIACSSYGKGTVSKGSPVMKKDMSTDPAGKHILLIEDIIDTGGTLHWLKNYLAAKNCASIKIACLLDKKARRSEKARSVHIDYAGFDCPNDFVVGYGMDFAGHYRCLPFVGVLKPEAYKSK